MGVVVVLLCIVLIRTKEQWTIHDLITIWAYKCFDWKLNSSQLILWCLIPKVSILKINTQVLHEEEDDHNTTDDRKEYGAEDR